MNTDDNGEQKSKSHKITVTTEQKEKLENMAKSAGMTLENYIVKLLTDELSRREEEVK